MLVGGVIRNQHLVDAGYGGYLTRNAVNAAACDQYIDVTANSLGGSDGHKGSSLVFSVIVFCND
jgi:hypothetical protein